jgi:hypothetical protein
MKTLSVALIFGFLSLAAAGCSGGSSLPVVTPQTPVARHAHHHIAPSDCQNDSGGAMTGDGPSC